MGQTANLAQYQTLISSWVVALNDKRDRLAEDLEKLRLAYPSWRSGADAISSNATQHDARPEYFLLLAVILKNVRLSFLYTRDQLCEREYWSRVEPLMTNENGILEGVNGYLTMARQYSVIQAVSITENTLATIAMSGHEPFVLTTSSGFDNVYKYVLSKLSLSPRFEELFDILRLVRNTEHSNGVYLPRRGGNVVKRYGGKEYVFNVGQLIDWNEDDMITSLFHWVREAMWEIICSPYVRSIPYVPLWRSQP